LLFAANFASILVESGLLSGLGAQPHTQLGKYYKGSLQLYYTGKPYLAMVPVGYIATLVL
jgi:ABC-type dipeptide/oligopeptide/nickel transport system permease subunit